MINPHSSECVSEEDVVFEIIAQPTISSYNNVLECVSQSSQVTTIVGENFVQWTETDNDGNPIEIKPTVKYGEIDLTGNDILLSNCIDLLGPFGGQTCTEITFDSPKMH